jgi:hypothetical protein
MTVGGDARQTVAAGTRTCRQTGQLSSVVSLFIVVLIDESIGLFGFFSYYSLKG